MCAVISPDKSGRSFVRARRFLIEMRLPLSNQSLKSKLYNSSPLFLISPLAFRCSRLSGWQMEGGGSTRLRQRKSFKDRIRQLRLTCTQHNLLLTQDHISVAIEDYKTRLHSITVITITRSIFLHLPLPPRHLSQTQFKQPKFGDLNSRSNTKSALSLDLLDYEILLI